MLLAGDIGGTKTSLALFDETRGLDAPIYKDSLRSGRYPSLESLVRDFLGQAGEHPAHAVFAVAGPVIGGRSEITNLPWVLDEHTLQGALSLETVRLINDLAALAYAIPHLEPKDLHTLQEGRPVAGGSIAVIAPGTGLGEAYLTWDGGRYLAFPSEGGHTDFGPTSPLEAGLLRYLQERLGHVSYERIASGSGIPNIFNYLKAMGFAAEPDWLTKELAAAEDPAPVIFRAALAGEPHCDLCRTTLEIFISVLGSETGNLALKVMATGGVYLGGGIPARIMPALNTGAFRQAFLNKGRFADLLEDFPVHVITDAGAGLRGAAHWLVDRV
ncbi:MAG TPA: glucokinase [Anaerolineales bacterium]|nr:glucokinase [Anaerolineales bacterium]